MRDLLPIGPKLLPRQETQLATLVNPTYLMTSTIASVREQLKQQGSQRSQDLDIATLLP